MIKRKKPDVKTLIFILYNKSEQKYVNDNFKTNKDFKNDEKIGKLLGYPCPFTKEMLNKRNKTGVSHGYEIYFDIGDGLEQLFAFVCDEPKKEYLDQMYKIVEESKKIFKELGIKLISVDCSIRNEIKI